MTVTPDSPSEPEPPYRAAPGRGRRPARHPRRRPAQRLRAAASDDKPAAPPARRPRTTRSASRTSSRSRSSSSTAASATKYATDVHVAAVQEEVPEGARSSSSTRRRSSPSCSRGSPAATRRTCVNNSGAEDHGPGALVAGRPAGRPDRAVGRAVARRPGKKVRDTLVAGTVEQGTFNGKPYVLNYAYTVYGHLVRRASCSRRTAGPPPKTWDEFTALCEARSRPRASPPYTYAGTHAAYYQST